MSDAKVSRGDAVHYIVAASELVDERQRRVRCLEVEGFRPGSVALRTAHDQEYDALLDLIGAATALLGSLTGELAACRKARS